jgi:hypothetical protein
LNARRRNSPPGGIVSDIRYWSELGRGGHFVAGEAPILLAKSIRAFFRFIRQVAPGTRLTFLIQISSWWFEKYAEL